MHLLSFVKKPIRGGYLILSHQKQTEIVMKNSKSIVTEIIINAPAERVWEILTNTEKYADWNPFLLKIKGEIKIGNRLENTMKNGNSTIIFKPQVLQVIPENYFEWLGKLWVSGIFDGRHYFRLEKINSTQIKLTHGEEFSGLLSGYVLKKNGNEIRQNFVEMNQALKRRAENQQ